MSLPIAAFPSAAQGAPTDQNLATAATRTEALVAPQMEAELLSGFILIARDTQIL